MIKTRFQLRSIVLIAVLVLVFAACSKQSSPSGQESGPVAMKGKLVIWSFLDTFFVNGGICDEFTRMYPEVTFEYVPIVAGDLMTKIQQTLASGGEMPDIISYESSFWKKANNMDLCVHLEDYGIRAEDYMDFTSTGMLDKDNHVQGINYQLNVGAIAIKNDMAQKYLGTTDRDELVEMFSTSDKLIAVGKRVMQETNGKIKMFGAMNFFNFWFNFRTGGACENEKGEFELTKNHLPVYENLLKFWRSGIIDNALFGTPLYIGQLTDDVHIAMMTCTGDTFYTLIPNDPEGKVKLTLIPLPQDIGSFQFGGTSHGVVKTSKNIPVAVEFLRYFLHDMEGVKWGRDNLGSFVPLKAAYSDPATLGPYTFKNYGDFDYGGFFCKEGTMVPAIPYSEYDQVVRQAMDIAETELLVNNTITAQELVQLEINEVKAKLPDVVIR